MRAYSDQARDERVRRLKQVARRLLGRDEYATVDITRIDRKVGKLRRIAWLVDAALHLPGTRFRFGLNSMIGLPPGLGDAALAAISLYIVFEAARLGAPARLLYRMLGNVAIEAALGAVPVIGDLLDIVWKANLRNIALLEGHYGITPREPGR